MAAASPTASPAASAGIVVIVPSEVQLRKLFIRAIEILVEDLRHGEHMHPVLFEDCAHRVVASDLASIARILEIVGTDVLPEPFNRLRT